MGPQEQLGTNYFTLTFRPHESPGDSLAGTGVQVIDSFAAAPGTGASLRLFEGAGSQANGVYDIAFKRGGGARTDEITAIIPNIVPAAGTPLASGGAFDGTALWLGHSRFQHGKAPPLGSDSPFTTGTLWNGTTGPAERATVVRPDDDHLIDIPVVQNQVTQRSFLVSAQVYAPTHAGALSGISPQPFLVRTDSDGTMLGLTNPGGVGVQQIDLSSVRDQWASLQVRADLTTNGGALADPSDDTGQATFRYFLNGAQVGDPVTLALAPNVMQASKSTGPVRISPAFGLGYGWQGYAPEAFLDNIALSEIVAKPLGSVITMPLEVMGADGTTSEISVPLGSSGVAAGGLKLSMQVHGLDYETKASVQINGSSWIPLNNTNSAVVIAAPGKGYGGIGGGFSTVKMTVDVPAGAAVAGNNTIRFRFNETNGVSIGYRVLRFNVLNTSGQPLLPDTLFTQDDPNTWTPPHTSAAEIAQGKDLWLSATLLDPESGAPLRAHCTDCHVRDGRDLRYFNYSNHAIIERSKFHSLTQSQGELIASYIRSESGPNPGRPWNPPFQPGPGLDNRPFDQWSAGAGIDAVLDNDTQMMPYLFPNGITQDRVAVNAPVNAREIPIALQLPDWNHWLPRVHPLDVFGDAWEASEGRKRYDGGGTYAGSVPDVRSVFAAPRGTSPDDLERYREASGYFAIRVGQFVDPYFPTTNLDPSWTREMARQIYSSKQWVNVKNWEVAQEFQVQGNQMVTDDRESRSWLQINQIFGTAPHIMHIPDSMSSINTTSDDTHNKLIWTYYSAAWYQLQFVTNLGNHTDGQYRDNQSPIDWTYSNGFLKDLPNASGNKTPLMYTLFTIKGYQAMDNPTGLASAGPPSATGPRNTAGWSPSNSSSVFTMIDDDFVPQFNVLAPADKIQIYNTLLRRWFDKTKTFTPDQYNVTDYAQANDALPTDANGNPVGAWPYSKRLLQEIWYMVPLFRQQGVDGALLDQICDWGATLWPNPDANNKTSSPRTWASLKSH